jgi:predicted pyridoxine 5'-phosphate oxidase superfamily flavin-nucleotide-binding protein
VPAHPALPAPPCPCTTDPVGPGSHGEHRLQTAFGTRERAARFYTDQVRDRLLPKMIEFVARMEMVFIATSDAHGDCDASLRAGPPGFVRVLNDRTLAYPEYRGNGVMAGLGNLSENPHIGLLMIDFVEDLIGLHINGRAHIMDNDDFHARHPGIDHAPCGDREPAAGPRPQRWVLIEVTEAYIHCRKHIPRMQRLPQKRAWGTDDPARKGGDYFGARPAGPTPTDPTPADPTPADLIPRPRNPIDPGTPARPAPPTSPADRPRPGVAHTPIAR